MSIQSTVRGKTTRWLGRLVSIAALTWALGLAYVPTAFAASSTPVPVDQQPLTVQKPLPPDIVLMVDDSGSMRFDVMPDYSDLSSTATAALINSAVNGLYYNPTQKYLPPYKVDGNRYPNASFTSAWPNGFDTSIGTVSLATYDGYYDTSGTGGGGYGGYGATKVDYSAATTTSQRYSNVYNNADCSSLAQSQGAASFDFSGRYNQCTLYFVKDPYFQYATGSTNTVHYVAATSCNGKTNCVLASDTSGIAAPSGIAAGTNIANWFSYYHTRILMAKSGLMNAFNTLDPTYRLGFGSINNSNSGDITSLGSGRYTTKNNLDIANVAVFGDGSAGTQRANFWKWVVDLYPPTKGTPLRKALDAVGQYYQTKQPWETSDSDQTCHACRLAYSILTTDGFWNGADPGVGDVDGANGPTIKGPSGQTGGYVSKQPYADQGLVTQSYSTRVYSAQECKDDYKAVTGTYNGYQDSYYQRGRWSSTCSFTYTGPGAGYQNTLADVAMKYWSNDLRTDIDNEVPVSKPDDEAFWQHMTTFTLGLGYPAVDGDNNNAKLDVDAIFNWAHGGAPISGFNWPKPGSDSINNISDMAHAALNGHGLFASASDPESFTASLTKALDRASQRTGTGVSLAANSTELTQNTFVYQAKYITSEWTGDLIASEVDPQKNTISSIPAWSAREELPQAADRQIYISTGSSMVKFQNTNGAPPTNLTSAELAALGSTDTVRAQMIDYLRGDPSKEIRNKGPYRDRVTPLGDIVDSEPIYSGAPNANQFVGKTFTGSADFATYAANNASRAGMIYVAANDGLLHGFDAATGAETFAFLPAYVLTDGGDLADGTQRGLSLISDPAYGSDTSAGRHQFFNDGEMTVADAYFGSAWHTVLVGTTGRGMAKSVYALDVTDPAKIKFLWERSAHDGKAGSDYIGQMNGKPVIAQTADGSWSVLMGNGFNSAKGTAALLQFDLTDGTLHVHSTNTATGNGLSAPAVWIGSRSDGISVVAYAGDLQGNVWSFDLYDETNAVADTGSSGKLLYVAKDAGGTRQPITSGVLIGRNPDTSDLWLFFGTGRYLAAEDLADAQVQTWYGLIVDSATSGRAVTATTTRSSLTKQTFIAQVPGSTTTITNPDGTTSTQVTLPARVVSQNDMGTHSGWYLDLQAPVLDTNGNITGFQATGERMVTPSLFHGSLLWGTDRAPTTLDVCSASGTSWLMTVDPFTGGNPKDPVFDLNGDGVIDGNDMVTVGGKSYAVGGVGLGSMANNPRFVGDLAGVSLDNGDVVSLPTSGGGGAFKRVSWRELINQ